MGNTSSNTSKTTDAHKSAYLNPNVSLEKRVEDALSRMTLHEKISVLHGQSKFTSPGVPRLGIRELHYSDGPHGVRAEVDWNTWDSANWTNDAIVAFPSLSCLAATWNVKLSELYGNAVSEEFAFRGKDVMLGPGTSIVRIPLNGRNFEYMGEDPFLSGTMAVPYIRAAQKNGVACCVKHFFLNNQEVNRFGVNVNVSERAVEEIYLPSFRRAVQDGGSWTVMASYPLWKGVHCCQNNELLNGILKKRWGFDGAVVSDWGGVTDTWQAATGGMDLEMGSFTNGKTEDNSKGYETYYLADSFEKLIRDGKIPESVLDDKASRVLRTIFRTCMNPDKVIGSQCSESHYSACLSIGEEGIVLLKNSDRILPVEAEKYQRILVVGENAARNLCEGGGSSELKTKYDILPLQALKEVYGDKIDYAEGYASGRPLYDEVDEVDPSLQEKLRCEALKKAENADLIIFIGGLNKNTKQDCEDGDRDNYHLSFGQDELISDLAKIQNNIVVVTFGGNAYATPWIDEVKALVHTWYLGSMEGLSLVNVLSGKVNPSGKLPVTFARRLKDYSYAKFGKEAYPGVGNQVNYKEGIYVGYRYFSTYKVKPQFPFGFGLSYTTFRYGQPHIEGNKVSVDVTNVGDRAGKEIVEFYVNDEDCSVDRPVRELKGFQKLELRPGETKTAVYEIQPDDLRFYDEACHSWKTEAGVFNIEVGASSEDIRGSVSYLLS
jgi:beta-glucosidase